MQTTITITRKGQTTLPVSIRRRLGIGPLGGQLTIVFDERKSAANIKKQLTIDELSKKATSYIRPGTKPLTDVDAYYQKHRRVRWR